MAVGPAAAAAAAVAVIIGDGHGGVHRLAAERGRAGHDPSVGRADRPAGAAAATAGRAARRGRPPESSTRGVPATAGSVGNRGVGDVAPTPSCESPRRPSRASRLVASTSPARVSVAAVRAAGGSGDRDIGRLPSRSQRVAPGSSAGGPRPSAAGARGTGPSRTGPARAATRCCACARGAAVPRRRAGPADRSPTPPTGSRSARCRARCEPMADPQPGARHRTGSRRHVPALAVTAPVGSCRRAGSRDRPGAPHGSLTAGRRSDRNHPVTMIGPLCTAAGADRTNACAMNGRRWRPFGATSSGRWRRAVERQHSVR